MRVTKVSTILQMTHISHPVDSEPAISKSKSNVARESEV
ncbi:hypothetical protein OIU78_002184 [Salix suchowensis]|nr:hypothetical protein OIU78_002184 [Salix suchowensis]